MVVPCSWVPLKRASPIAKYSVPTSSATAIVRSLHVARALRHHLRSMGDRLQPCHLGPKLKGGGQKHKNRLKLHVPICATLRSWQQGLLRCLHLMAEVILGANALHMLLLGDFGYYYIKPSAQCEQVMASSPGLFERSSSMALQMQLPTPGDVHERLPVALNSTRSL